TTTTGNVNIKYVDTDGNEIKELYNLVENGLVSTTTTTTTTTDGIASVSEKTVDSGLTYDATTQKQEIINYDGKLYEFTKVQDGDVEQGLVTEGTTTITYIYKLAPNTTETTSTPVTGTVVTRYVDEDTGEELVPGSTIVDNGVVANIVTTTVRDVAGKVVSETAETVPTDLTYDTTADKIAKNAEIALIRVSATEYVTPEGQIVTPDANGYITFSEHEILEVESYHYSNQDLADSFNQTYMEHYEKLINSGQLIFVSLNFSWVAPPTPHQLDKNLYVGNMEYDVVYKMYVGNKTVSYSLTRVDKSEVGVVEEGTTVITYYYRRLSYLYKDALILIIPASSTVASLARDF
ncbi:MucBP domain-containing protein, partial [Streptococcus suis]|uniref:MucBP domain-containing protein n=2 Tax=Streptococcus suis TaxID=1307 RepID=UPI001B7D7890